MREMYGLRNRTTVFDNAIKDDLLTSGGCAVSTYIIFPIARFSGQSAFCCLCVDHHLAGVDLQVRSYKTCQDSTSSDEGEDEVLKFISSMRQSRPSERDGSSVPLLSGLCNLSFQEQVGPENRPLPRDLWFLAVHL